MNFMLKLNTATSLIGSLSQEVQLLRQRMSGITKSINNSKDLSLLERLKKELEVLDARKQEILNIALTINQFTPVDKLNIEFLIEICRRPNKY